jgi:hypothetical protein
MNTQKRPINPCVKFGPLPPDEQETAAYNLENGFSITTKETAAIVQMLRLYGWKETESLQMFLHRQNEAQYKPDSINLSETPLADRYAAKGEDYPNQKVVPVEIARKLEREYTVWRKMAERLDRKVIEEQADHVKTCGYHDATKARICVLQEANAELANKLNELLTRMKMGADTDAESVQQLWRNSIITESARETLRKHTAAHRSTTNPDEGKV